MPSRASARPDMPLPEVEAPDLAHVFLLLGRVQPTPEGIQQLSATEIRAWMEGTQTGLSAWEFATLLDMSREYVSESRQARSPGRPSPWIMPVTAEDQAAMKKRIRESRQAG